MNELLTLNLFAELPGVAWIGLILCGGLIALPPLFASDALSEQGCDDAAA